MNKQTSARKFILSLDNHERTLDLVTDRVDLDIQDVIKDYSKLVTEVIHNCKSKYEMERLIGGAILTGYLLKSHVDRQDLEEVLKLHV